MYCISWGNGIIGCLGEKVLYIMGNCIIGCLGGNVLYIMGKWYYWLSGERVYCISCDRDINRGQET